MYAELNRYLSNVEIMQSDLPERSIRKKLFAYIMSRTDEKIDSLFGLEKKELLQGISGTVLEIGPGTGTNFEFIPAGVRYIAVEPNQYMHKYLTEKAEKYGLNLEIRRTTANNMRSIKDASVEVVISTHVLCSINDQAEALDEIVRVLKPGGKLLFLEHVAAHKGTIFRKFQGFLKPFWKIIADGCNIQSDTLSQIQSAGFSQVEHTSFTLSFLKAGPVSPHIYGTAIKSEVSEHDALN